MEPGRRDSGETDEPDNQYLELIFLCRNQYGALSSADNEFNVTERRLRADWLTLSGDVIVFLHTVVSVRNLIRTEAELYRPCRLSANQITRSQGRGR